LPAAAPAPANDAASVETVIAAHVAVLAVVRVGEEVPSSYLSRGPPAS
jgi:hypothetical protein